MPHRPFRAEHIGSLLRPAALRAARTQLMAGGLDAAGLRAAEDAAVLHVVKMQEDAGLQVLTDGEMRRNTYSDSFTVGGLHGVEIRLTEQEGWSKSETHGHRTARRIPAVTGKIAWKGPQNAADFAFLKSVASRTPKITLPGPAYIHYRAGRANIDKTAYPDLDGFFADLVEAYGKEIKSLYDVGCRYVQIDETSLVKLGDERARQLLADRGDHWADLLKLYVEVVNGVARTAPACTSAAARTRAGRRMSAMDRLRRRCFRASRCRSSSSNTTTSAPAASSRWPPCRRTVAWCSASWRRSSRRSRRRIT